MPVAIILEPDSLPNLVTNEGVRGCGAATRMAYREGVVGAARRLLEAAPNAAIYLDAGPPHRTAHPLLYPSLRLVIQPISALPPALDGVGAATPRPC